jgi:hypothetical protein
MHRPNSFQTIVELSNLLVGSRAPNIDNIIFSSSQKKRQIRVKNDRSDTFFVALVKGINALARLIIPNLDKTIIRSRSKMRFLVVLTEVNCINTTHVTNKRKVWGALLSLYAPNLDSAVKTTASKHVGILGIDS